MARSTDSTDLMWNLEFVCSICLEDLKDSVVLSKCGHSYCKKCVARLNEVRGLLSDGLVCPSCKSFNSKSQQKPNYQLREATDCMENLIKKHNDYYLKSETEIERLKTDIRNKEELIDCLFKTYDLMESSMKSEFDQLERRFDKQSRTDALIVKSLFQNQSGREGN